MSKFAGKDLNRWRKIQEISVYDLAGRISCDAKMIYHLQKESDSKETMVELQDNRFGLDDRQRSDRVHADTF